ncbi:hypothetical protein CesoFtcFv8_000092 [Champsocephalus esox]|nr:hypothetical protein CesoFtcFv8_000092 [Champsocephalus esox]
MEREVGVCINGYLLSVGRVARRGEKERRRPVKTQSHRPQTVKHSPRERMDIKSATVSQECARQGRGSTPRPPATALPPDAQRPDEVEREVGKEEG